MRADASQSVVAPQDVQIIARQKYHLTGTHLDRWLTFDNNKKPPFDDEMIGDQQRQIRHVLPTVLGGKPGDHAPRRGKASVEKDAA